jgi:hypothetical protein
VRTSTPRAPVVYASEAFAAPNAAGVQFQDILTRFVNGLGGINSVIDGTGAAATATTPGPSDVVSYP